MSAKSLPASSSSGNPDTVEASFGAVPEAASAGRLAVATGSSASGSPLAAGVSDADGGATTAGSTLPSTVAATGSGAEVATLPQIARTIAPDSSLKDAFDAGHARFRAAQSAIKDLT